MRRCDSVLLVLAFLAPAMACGGDAEPSEPPMEFAAATKLIGPEGGELVGTAENRFPGVKLVIPPGALAKTETISFEGAIDETELPPGAERVGPQVRVLPEGLTLAVPARLTLPMDRELRDAFEDPPEDCKVWARDGAAWTRLEPVATTADSVTVETTSFTTAAAGVRFLIRTPVACADATCSIPRVDAGPCTSPLGYCLTSVPDPPDPIQSLATSSLHVARYGAATNLYYLELKSGLVTAIRYDLESHVATRFVPHRPAVSGLIRYGRAQPSEDDSIWAMIGGYGFVKFPRLGSSKAFDTNLEPEALIVHPRVPFGEESVMRFSSFPLPLVGVSLRSFFLRTNDRPRRAIFTGPGADSLDAHLRLRHLQYDNNSRTGAALFFATTRRGLCLGNYILRDDGSDASTCDPSKEGRGDESKALISEGDRVIPEIGVTATQLFTPFQVPHYALASPASSATKEVLFATADPAGRRTKVTLSAAASSMAFDDSSTLYVVNTSRPEVTIVDRDGQKRTLKLTLAAPGTPEHEAMVPRRIMQVPQKDELLILLRGAADGTKRLVRLRKSG